MKLEKSEYENAVKALAAAPPGETRDALVSLLNGSSYVDDNGDEVTIDVKSFPAPAQSSEVKHAKAENQVGVTAEQLDEMLAAAADKAVSRIEARSRGNPLPSPVPKSADIAFPIRRKPRNFKSIDDAILSAHWLLAIQGNQKSSEIVKNHANWDVKTHTTTNNGSLGHLVFPAFEASIIDLRDLYGVFRNEANFKVMPSDTHSIPRRVSGLTSYFTTEGVAITESPDKVVDLVTLTARKLGAIALISSELNDDSIISVVDDLSQEIAYSFSIKEDDCGFNGDGTSGFGGIVGVRSALSNLDSTVANIAGLQVATGTGYASSYGAITLADFHGVMGRLPEYAARAPGGPKWYCSKAFKDTVMHKLATAAGGNTVREIAGGAIEERFLGYPIVTSEVLPKSPATNQVVCLFGSLRLGVAFGERRGITLQVSNSAVVGGKSVFERDLLAIKGTERFDIVVHDVGNASSVAANRVAGPIVGLITGAS